MKVLLISANTEMINMPVLPLGLGCVAGAVQQAGHQVRLLNLMAHDDVHRPVESSIKDFQPDAVGISVRNIDDQVMAAPKFLLEPVKEIVAICRRYTGAPIVLGGAGYSIFPESALDYLRADMGIQGQGERSFVMLLERMQQKADPHGVPGLYLPKTGLQGKTNSCENTVDFPIPLPNEHISVPAALKQQPIWLPFQTRRGCPMNCSYCSTAAIEGRIIQKRKIQQVVDGLCKFTHAGFDHFFFVDNTFNLPPSYAKELCERIFENGLQPVWRCIVYPHRIDEELVAKMATAGCAEISLGFESGSNRILRKMNKRFSAEQVRTVSGIFKDYGIKQTGFLLLGGPGETKETVLESLAYAESLQLEAMKVTAGIRIYPATALSREAVAAGVVKSNEDLLFPRFFVSKGLDGWLQETVQTWVRDRPNWFH